MAAKAIQSIIDLGRSLDMEVVAEGVETETQAIALRARGATLGQGYFFARPMAPDAVAAALAMGKLPLALPLPLKRRRSGAKGA